MRLCLQRGGTRALLSGAVPPLSGPQAVPRHLPGCGTEGQALGRRNTTRRKRAAAPFSSGCSRATRSWGFLQGGLGSPERVATRATVPGDPLGAQQAACSRARSAGDPQQRGLCPDSAFIAQ